MRSTPYSYLLLLLALVLVLAACAEDEEPAADADDPDDAEVEPDDPDDEPDDPDDEAEEPAVEFPSDDITVVVPTAAGGAFDVTSRRLQEAFGDAIGANVTIDNREAGGIIAETISFADTGAECHDLMVNGTPVMQIAMAASGEDFRIDEAYYPVGSYYVDPSVVLLGPDSGFESMDDFLEAAQDDPGGVNVGQGAVDIGHLGMLMIEDAVGIDLNVVFYDGGGPTRDALISGEIDATHSGLFGSAAIHDQVEIAAVHQETNEWEDLTDGAPTVSEALGEDVGELGVEYQWYVTQECRDEHPEQYEILVEAMDEAVNSDTYLEQLEQDAVEGSLMWIDGPTYFEEQLEPRADEMAEQGERLGELAQ